MKAHIYSVSQVNKYIKNMLERDVLLNDIFIEAEISNFKAHSSGHFYFTLKDEFAAMNVVMYKTYAQNVKFLPENGMKVTVYGYISLYEKTGQYQLYAQIMEPTGKGALYMAFEQLKNKLEKEGLFNSEHKKRIPRFPKTIAVVTSPTGAVIRDVIRISQRRNPNVKIIVVPVLVQGDDAPKSICEGIAKINRYKKADVIILGRGGGSVEDLWCFNDEAVARAIFKSKIPIISAVGHETDFTISDFVADVRASTPSAAAEIAVGCLDDIRDDVYMLYKNLSYVFEQKTKKYENRLLNAVQSRALSRPLERISEIEKNIFDLQKEMNLAVFRKKEKLDVNFQNLVMRLESVSPMNVIRRGFAVVYKDEKPINSINSVDENDVVEIKMADGFLKGKIIEKGGADAKKENF